METSLIGDNGKNFAVITLVNLGQSLRFCISKIRHVMSRSEDHILSSQFLELMATKSLSSLCARIPFLLCCHVECLCCVAGVSYCTSVDFVSCFFSPTTPQIYVASPVVSPSLALPLAFLWVDLSAGGSSPT